MTLGELGSADFEFRDLREITDVIDCRNEPVGNHFAKSLASDEASDLGGVDRR